MPSVLEPPVLEPPVLEPPVLVPAVGIVMGSRSDADLMRAAAGVLDAFGVPYEFLVVSAHRTPDRMYTYAREAAGRGLVLRGVLPMRVDEEIRVEGDQAPRPS